MGFIAGTVVSLLVVLNFSFAAASKPCFINGTQWAEHDGHCYLFVSRSRVRMSYYEAEDYCREVGAHLVSIHSERENQFVLESMEERRIGGRSWVGLNLLHGVDSPRWSDNTTVDYQRRVEKDFSKNEKCFIMYLTQRGWRPEHCALHYPPICKISRTETPTPLPPVTPVKTPAGHCPDGWIQFGQKCYKYFGTAEEDRLKYSEARDACWHLGQGSDLVSIHSMEEQAFLTQHLADFGTSPWIGINKVASDEIGHDIVFGWVDNSRNDFSHWARGHPPPGTWKYCGRLDYEGVNKGEWIADYCDVNKRGYICQRPTDPSLPKPTPQPTNCGAGFHGYRKSCYRYVRQPQTQEKAEGVCRALGGHLVSIVDGFEQSFLHSLLKNESGAVGIGLKSVQGTRYFRWTDRHPLYYSNWADEQLRSGFPQSDESRCTYMDGDSDFKWRVNVCSRPTAYVCKTTTDVIPEEPVILGRCPVGESSWIDIGDNYCYHVPTSNRVLSWDATSRYCLSKGMKMISLHSDHEAKLLLAYLARESWPVHLGLIRAFDKKSFLWTDGTPLNYTNWADREPSSWSSDKNCASFSPTEGKWTPLGCSDGGVVLCRAEKLLKMN